ncbi:MAG: calcium-translocating P-type ATPase, PMCA-type [Bulleidia sp.]|nr:calcium-translocating P-type ATPase, PMCA-type [Bulleidia sp.]
MQEFNKSIEETIKETESTLHGLSLLQAEERLQKNGPNELEAPPSLPMWKRFINQLKDPMIIILLIAALISGITTYYESVLSQSSAFPTDSMIILIVVIINAVLGVVQESKAEKAIESLQKMSASNSKVLRDGKVMMIPSIKLVKGDVVLLEAGDSINADGRVMESASLTVEESALTGESTSVKKNTNVIEMQDIPLGDRTNMVYRGSEVVYGRGKVLVTATGMDTEMGKIARVISNTQEGKTPLQIKLSQLSKVLTKIVLGICVFIFAFSLFMNREIFSSGDVMAIVENSLDFFMVAVSLAVAAIPEGLVAVVTIVLSIGVTNMSKKKAIIRKMTAVETLGCASIICSDKTGTLTQNKMTVVKTYTQDESLLAKAMSLCNDAVEDDNKEVSGEPTEAALVQFAISKHLNKNELLQKQPRIDEYPFDSSRKLMSTIHQDGNGYIQYTKGAPDVLIARCTKILKDGAVQPMTKEDRTEILKANKSMADNALRVLAAAYTTYTDTKSFASKEAIEQNLIFIGLTGMIDPVRPEVKQAISTCKSAGITPIMITGDHLDTAVAIARELDILQDPSQAITGYDLQKMTDEEFMKNVQKYRVYARVQPEHKTRIVKAWKTLGKVVAMTGDGVNDAPSIKTADIGVGMGITGTDVTKNVADMVLADDNFATIVTAVGEGRRIYDNIRKAIQFLLSSNLSEVLSIFISTLLNFTILKAPHLLFINLVTDSLPSIALGMEKEETHLMDRKPRSSSEGIFAQGLGFNVVYQGIFVTLLTLAAFFIGERLETGRWVFANITDCQEGMTMAFLTMSMCEIFHSFNMRSATESIFTLLRQGNHNWILVGTMVASLVLTTCLIEVPFLADAFGFTPISYVEYGISLLLAISIIPLVEIVKCIQRKKVSAN